MIKRDIFIAAPPAVVWRMVTEPEQISRWFADEAVLELAAGGSGRLTFTDPAAAGPVSVRIYVCTVEPLREFAYRWPVPEGQRAAVGNSTLVRFLLAAEAGGTRLTVIESGMDDMPWTAAERAEFVVDHLDGWRQHFERLGTVLDVAPTP